MAKASAFDDLIDIATGPKGRVAVTPACHKAIEKASAEQRSRLTTLAERAVRTGFEELHQEQLAPEGRFPTGGSDGTSVLVLAFKAWKFRMYGSFRDIKGVKTFIGTVAVSKKQDKADRDDLERAAKGMANFISKEPRR